MSYGIQPCLSQDPHDELKQQNVLMEHCSLEETAQQFSLSVSELKSALVTAREKLYQHRLTRPRPHLDDKMIAAWNGAPSILNRISYLCSDSLYSTYVITTFNKYLDCM